MSRTIGCKTLHLDWSAVCYGLTFFSLTPISQVERLLEAPRRLTENVLSLDTAEGFTVFVRDLSRSFLAYHRFWQRREQRVVLPRLNMYNLYCFRYDTAIGSLAALSAPDGCAYESGASRREPVFPMIDEAIIKALMHGFYAKVGEKGQIGPIFNRVIGDTWDEHLAKMCDFWASVMLVTGRYKGNPVIAHMRLKMVRPEHFERWRVLFRETAEELFPPRLSRYLSARPTISPAASHWACSAGRQA